MSPLLFWILGSLVSGDPALESLPNRTLVVFTFRGKAIEPPTCEAFSDSLARRLGYAGGWQVVDRRGLKTSAGPGQGRFDQCDEVSCAIASGRRWGAQSAVLGWLEREPEGFRVRARILDLTSGNIVGNIERSTESAPPEGFSPLLDSLSKDLSYPRALLPMPHLDSSARVRIIDSLQGERRRRAEAGAISSGLAMSSLLVAGAFQMKHEYDCSLLGDGDLFHSPPGCEDPSRPAQVLAVVSAGLAIYGIMQFVGLAHLDDEIAKLSFPGRHQAHPSLQMDPRGLKLAMAWEARL